MQAPYHLFPIEQTDGVTSRCKIFADDTSLFSKVQDINRSANELNCDLEKVGQLHIPMENAI